MKNRSHRTTLVLGPHRLILSVSLASCVWFRRREMRKTMDLRACGESWSSLLDFDVLISLVQAVEVTTQWNKYLWLYPCCWVVVRRVRVDFPRSNLSDGRDESSTTMLSISVCLSANALVNKILWWRFLRQRGIGSSGSTSALFFRSLLVFSSNVWWLPVHKYNRYRRSYHRRLAVNVNVFSCWSIVSKNPEINPEKCEHSCL